MTLADTAGVGYVAFSGLLLVAQAAGLEGLSVEALTPITSVGFAVWYGWYVTSRAFPRMSELQKQQITELTQTYMDHMERERRFHHEQAEALRARVHEMANNAQLQMEKVVGAIEDLARVAGVIKTDEKGS